MMGVTALGQYGLVPCPHLLGPEEAQQSGSERGLAPGSRGRGAPTGEERYRTQGSH